MTDIEPEKGIIRGRIPTGQYSYVEIELKASPLSLEENLKAMIELVKVYSEQPTPKKIHYPLAKTAQTRIYWNCRQLDDGRLKLDGINEPVPKDSYEITPREGKTPKILLPKRIAEYLGFIPNQN